MHVAVTGASGFIGTALCDHLRAKGHRVTRLVRRTPQAGDEAVWDPDAGTVDTDALQQAEAVVHLAGEPIADRRWTAEQRRRIRDSRVRGTDTIARALAGLDDGAKVLVCASAMGFYGDRGDAVLTENEGPGDDFLADVVAAWEDAADPAREAGVRVAHLRHTLILGRHGGALPRLVLQFRLGAGGRFGSGRQWWSWASLTDTVAAYEHALASDGLSGPANVSSPNPVRNAEFARVLGRVLRRPAIFWIPKFGPWLVKGEAALNLLYTSIRVLPARLEADGFTFAHPQLEAALRHEIDGT
jgi:uncharacterized protein